MKTLNKIGQVPAKAAAQIEKARIGIGFEKLDRAVFDPEKAYDKVAAIGVKQVRIQSGWMRTEQEKGVYNWEWIDSIVDNLKARGMQPWVCLCYGNPLYSEAAKTVFGAVGVPPIFTEEEKLGWRNYVKAFVEHFKDRVYQYEVWNEPDGQWCWKHGVSAEEYGRFAADTAKYVKEVMPEAQVYGGVVCQRDLFYINTALQAGMGDVIDAITFHEYTPDETKVFERVATLRAVGQQYNPKMQIIQGESGSQSRGDGNGALHRMSWTPMKQAKQLLRHTIADLLCDVQFTSYFSAMDMIEALNGTVDDKNSYLDYGYFGVIGADFDENGIASGEYTPKISYYALQNLCSVFAEDWEHVTLPVFRAPLDGDDAWGKMNDYGGELISGGFRRADGSCAFVYWNPTDLMTSTFEHMISFQCVGLPTPIRVIDPMDGSIYEIPEEMLEDRGNGQYWIQHVPVKDYPMILTWGEFVK